MMNNITQVSPRNGVDFSKIRKAQQGTKIPKFLTPTGTIPQWYLNLYKNNYRLGNWNSGLNSSHAGATIVGAGNSSLHGKAGDLNAAYLSNAAYTGNSLRVLQDILAWYDEWVKDHPDATPLQMVDAYNQIAESIRQYQGVEHTYNSKGASTNNRAFKNMFLSRSLKTDSNADMSLDAAFIGYQDSGDDIYGSSSFLRRMDRYEKEYDDLTDEEKAARTHTIKIGDKDVQVYKKANGDISLLSDQPGTPSGTLPGNSPGTPPGTLPGMPSEKENPTHIYTPLEFPSAFNFKPQPFTSPITNGIIAGLGLAANKHVYDNEMQKKVPLLEAPYHQYITGAYKATVDAYNKAGSDIQSAANRIANQSSNLEQNQAIQLEGAVKALDKRLEGALKQQEGYNFDRGKSLETSYFNNDSDVSVANQNRSNLVADYNRKQDAKSKYQLQRNAIWADNIMKNRTDYGQWKANEENERDAALSSYNLYIANLRDQLIKKPYQDLLADASTSNAFNLIYQNALNDWNSKRETSWALNPENRDFTNIWTGLNDEATRRLNFLTYLQTHGDSTYGKQFTEGYNAEVLAAKNKYIQDAQSLQNDLMMIAPSFRLTYTTEGFYNPRRLGKQLRFVKEGGVLKMKRGSRFVDYLEHNRKALKDQKHTTMENAKQAQKALKLQLDAIDRETLILLRSIFK